MIQPPLCHRVQSWCLLPKYKELEETWVGRALKEKETTYGVESRLMLLACVDDADLWLEEKTGRLGEAWITWSTRWPTDDGRSRVPSWTNSEFLTNKQTQTYSVQGQRWKRDPKRIIRLFTSKTFRFKARDLYNLTLFTFASGFMSAVRLQGGIQIWHFNDALPSSDS